MESRSFGPTAPNVTAIAGADSVDLNELLTVEDVAALLRVSRSWVYEHTRSRTTPRTDRLPHLKIGKYLRFEAAAVRAFLANKSRSC